MSGSNLRVLTAATVALTAGTACMGAAPSWTYLSSRTGALPPPGSGSQQTASLVLDIDCDGTDDFVITERTGTPSVVWYKYRGNGKWSKLTIHDEPLHVWLQKR